MSVKVLIFDIGGTIFDWNTALLESLAAIEESGGRAIPDKEEFTLDCRGRFLVTSLSIVRGEAPWLTSDQILAKVVEEAWTERNWKKPRPDLWQSLITAWRQMPAWPGAAAAIRDLRQHYVVAPLTVLSWSMAVGSSRRNGINWDGVLCCDVLGAYKPDPRCFLRAADIMDCQPSEMMMVASHPSDLRAAIKCGYRSAYLLPRLQDPGDDYTDTGFVSEFDVVAGDFGELASKLVRPLSG